MSAPALEGPARRPARSRRRRVLRTLLAVLLVVALVWLAASAFLALRIRSDVLAVRSADPVTVGVVAVDGATITVDDADERRPELRQDVRYGLAWPEGYGEVSGVPVEEGSRVTRDLEVRRGPPPEEGQPVELVRDLVDPEAAVPLVETEQVTFPTGRGELPALFAPGRSTTWAVLVHGKDQRPEETLRLAQATVGAGLPTLAITYRNDPGVPEDPGGRHTFGQTEWRDLEAAVTYAQDQGAESVVLGGISMGGSIIAAYLESSERESGLVTGVVLDSPVLDLAAVVDNGAARLDLPLGLQVPGAVVATGRGLSALLDDVDWAAVDYLDDTSWLQVPTLLLHTVEDTTVPIAVSRELVAREPDLARLVELDGGHTEGYNADPARYLAEVTELLDEVS